MNRIDSEPEDFLRGVGSAILFVMALLALWALAVVLLSLEAVVPAPAQERISKHPEACIQSYGPGERWLIPSHTPLCAGPAGAVPANVMSHPLGERE
jgi:hypothetical protein